MRLYLTIPVLASLVFVAGCDASNPTDRTIGGALIGAGSGAAIGAMAGGGPGAAIGALSGAAVGGTVGYATTPDHHKTGKSGK